MERKLLFVWRILIYDMIKPFPCAAGYFNRYFCLVGQGSALNAPPSRYMQIVRVGKELSGWFGVVLANTALMFFCLPISFLGDCLIHMATLIWIKILANAALALMMLEKFDMLRLCDSRNYLKLLYLAVCLFSSSYWTMTCAFLAAFENIAF